ncbi:MAG: DUF935 family protein [Candidatus Hydrogenedens sp.]|nr:DUF935 family protein [Candidatus Hydrogenedens sp.]
MGLKDWLATAAAALMAAAPDRRLAEEEATPTQGGVRSALTESIAARMTPERLAALLHAADQGDGRAFLQLADDIELADLHYRAVLTTRRLAVAQAPLTVTPASDDARDVEIAALVEQALTGPDAGALVFDLLDGLNKGFAVVEIVWTGGERWVPAQFRWRRPDWFQLDPIDLTTLRLVDGSADGAELTPHHYVIHLPPIRSGPPLRRGLARTAVWAWMFKAFSLKDWVAFAEAYGFPIRIGKYSGTMDRAERAQILRILKGIAADACAVLPANVELIFEQLSGDSGSNGPIWERLCAYLDQQVSKLVLGQTATTDAIAGGHAVGREHREVQEDIERADARAVAATLTRDLVRPLVGFNFGWDAPLPQIVIGRPDELDPQVLGAVLPALIDRGLKVGQNEIRGALKLRAPKVDEEVLAAAAKAPPPGGPPGGTASIGAACPGCGQPISAHAADRPGDAHDLVDRSIAAMMDGEGWHLAADPILAPLLAAALGVDSFEAFKAKLLELAVSDQGLGAASEPLAQLAALARGAGAAGDGR